MEVRLSQQHACEAQKPPLQLARARAPYTGSTRWCSTLAATRAAPATRAMKIKSAVKRLCEHCYMVRRGKTLYVRCTKNPRHKQRQGFATLATRGPPEPPRAWLSPLTRGDPAAAVSPRVDHSALLERLFASVK